MTRIWPEVELDNLLTRSVDRVQIDPDALYREITVRMWGKGVCLRRLLKGSEMSGVRRFVASRGHFIVARIGAEKGAMGLVPPDLSGALVSSDFLLFAIDQQRLLPSFLGWYSKTRTFREACAKVSEGTTRIRLQEKGFLALTIPLPPLDQQKRAVASIERLEELIDEARVLQKQAAEESGDIVPQAAARLFEAMSFPKQPLSEAADKKTGIAYRAADLVETGTVPVVRLKEIGTRRPTVYLRNPDEYRNVWLEEGDIVLAKTSFSTGAMCQWSGPPAVLNQNAVMLRARGDLEQRYLFAWLRQQVSRYLSVHLADPDYYPYIRESDLMKWEVQLPPLIEQRRIVAELDALQACAEAAQRLQTEIAIELDALLPSILDRAFKGEL
jgi:type I restriction enzyme S subunit